MLPFLLCFIFTSIAQARADDLQHFGEWLAACQPDGSCQAWLRSPTEAKTADVILSAGRQAQGTYWELSLTMVTADPNLAQPVIAHVDDTGFELTYPADIAPFGARNDFFLLGAKSQEIMDRLVTGTSFSIDLAAKDGHRFAERFSLAGLAKALIWIDTNQHRIGSERVVGAPPYGLFRPDVLGAAWMQPALAAFF